MKSRSVYIVIAFLCFFHPLAQAESMAEKFVRIEEAHREKGMSEPPKSMDEYRQMQREIYGEFSVRDLFQVVRERLARLDEPLPQGFDQIRIEALASSLVGSVFDVMQYARTEDFWADVTLELQHVDNTPVELIAILEALHMAEFPRNENLVHLSDVLQKIYRDDARRVDVRAAAIRSLNYILKDEYGLIVRSDPAVQSHRETTGKELFLSSPDLWALQLSPETKAKLDDLDSIIAPFLLEIISLYDSTEHPELKRDVHGAAYRWAHVPTSAMESAQSLLEQIDEAEAEAKRQAAFGAGPTSMPEYEGAYYGKPR